MHRFQINTLKHKNTHDSENELAPKTNMTIENNYLKMFPLLITVTFHCHASFRGGNFSIFGCINPNIHNASNHLPNKVGVDDLGLQL